MSELDFIVEHRAGNKIPHVGALSRHVDTISSDNKLRPEEVLDEQRKDQFCKELKHESYSSRLEFFYDDEGHIYRRQINNKHQLLIPRALVKRVIRENHDSVYAAHPGVKRTLKLLALNFSWPRLRKSVENYVNECDSCQRRKGSHEYKAHLSDPGNPVAPFEVISMDIKEPYLLTPRKNRYLLTFMDHFSKYEEIFPIEDHSTLTCARVYASQIITRHGSGSKLITDQGAAFMSSFFNDTCKILGIQRTRTSSYHAMSNGQVERLHRTLHTTLSHYVTNLTRIRT